MTDSQKMPVEQVDDLVAEALKSRETVLGVNQEMDSDEFDLNDVEVLGATNIPPKVEIVSEEDMQVEEDLDLEEQASTKADPMLMAMISAKNEAVAALEQTQKEALASRDQLLRVSAEFENFKKRQIKEKTDAIRFANESLLKDFLPILDNFDRSMSGMQEKESDVEQSADVKNLIEGVTMVLNQFQTTLKKHGVEVFSSKGEVFDPAFHEAISAQEDKTVPNNTILEEYQRGYTLNGRLVRPALVVVSSGGPAAVKK